MAKVGLTKIAPIKNGDTKEIEINGEKIEVRQYLSTKDKIALTERVLAGAFDESSKYSIFRLNILTDVEIIKTYTNINITAKQMEDIPSLYDLLSLNHIVEKVITAIPNDEYQTLINKIKNEADNLQHYLNSLAGVMKTITTDYENTKLDVDETMAKLDNPEAISTIKEILDKIG